MDSILVIVPITIATLLFLIFKNYKPRRLPPGPYGLPIVGRLPFLSINLHRNLADITQAYGPISSFRMGTRLCVAIGSSSAAMQVLREQDSVFANRAVPTVATIVTNGGLDVVWANYGAQWRFGRRMALHELLTPMVIGSFMSLRRREVHGMVRYLHSKAGQAVDMRETVSTTALNVILGMIWDDALGEGTEEVRAMTAELKEVVDDVVLITGLPNTGDFIPALKSLDLQGLQKRMTRVAKRYDAVFHAIIEHKRTKKTGGEVGGDDNEKPKDFLQLLLDIVERRDPDKPLEIGHIQALMLDLITAAVDTSTGTVEWAMAQLARNPTMIARAQEELDRVIGEGGVLEESHLSSLRYLDAIVKETLRMYPPLPTLLPHAPSVDSVVDGYTIPKGTTVFINVWGIHRDESVWECPHEFKPERFLEEKNKREYNGSYDYMPFGKGRRMCVGMNLGQRMVMYMLGSLLHSTNWKMPDGVTEIGIEEKFLVVLKKVEALVLSPHVRMPQYSLTNSTKVSRAA